MLSFKKIFKVLISFLILFNFSNLLSNELSEISKLRVINTSEGSRIIIESEKSIKYEVFSLKNPSRLVVDLAKIKFSDNFLLPKKKGIVEKIRIGSFSNDISRIVFDLNKPLKNIKTKLLTPSSGEKRMLSIELESNNKVLISKESNNYTNTYKKIRSSKKRKTIVIDPGHGGKDPGTSFLGELTEKDIVLSFSKILKNKLIDNGYRVFLTRDKDEFIKLNNRVEFAKKKGADLFISIHADASNKESIRGFSVYTLSRKKMDKEAEKVANLENKGSVFSRKGLIGINLQQGRSVIEHYHINKAFKKANTSSKEFSDILVNRVSEKTILLNRPQRYAGFAVLKSPNYPSVLVELGFITNKKDRNNLKSRNWQSILANKFVDAINENYK
ncbi:MAG: N-acetylmuramoyl-L-alanine amidase [Rhizobiales bacterium TMED168]|nr:MAG: N-acetylmuramoyl-L-alanine amidase [Rhizobiales bacterium TMED168]|tara:strand:- start:22985 stop:24145 length:1161 start_codon:yes stop_codon:yes gene_type:complete